VVVRGERLVSLRPRECVSRGSLNVWAGSCGQTRDAWTSDRELLGCSGSDHERRHISLKCSTGGASSVANAFNMGLSMCHLHVSRKGHHRLQIPHTLADRFLQCTTVNGSGEDVGTGR